jgi:hypothetical protein
MSYTPKPIDTAAVRLPASLDPLIERLSEHVHDLWAEQRMAEGWTPGPTRDDRLKQHPDLVEYASLSEQEKAYDRKSVIGTLTAILALGYSIEKK